MQHCPIWNLKPKTTAFFPTLPLVQVSWYMCWSWQFAAGKQDLWLAFSPFHQQGLVCITFRRKLTPKAFPKWNAGGLLCSSHWIAVMTLNLIIGCSIASGRSLARLSLLTGHHPCFLLYAAAFSWGGCTSDSGGTGPVLGCLHAQLVLRSRVLAECF